MRKHRSFKPDQKARAVLKVLARKALLRFVASFRSAEAAAYRREIPFEFFANLAQTLGRFTSSSISMSGFVERSNGVQISPSCNFSEPLCETQAGWDQRHQRIHQPLRKIPWRADPVVAQVEMQEITSLLAPDDWQLTTEDKYTCDHRQSLIVYLYRVLPRKESVQKIRDWIREWKRE
jgi:hypothetical protein